MKLNECVYVCVCVCFLHGEGRQAKKKSLCCIFLGVGGGCHMLYDANLVKLIGGETMHGVSFM